MATDFRNSLGWLALQAQAADIQRQQREAFLMKQQRAADEQAVFGRNMEVAKQLQGMDQQRFDRDLKMAEMAGQIDASGGTPAPDYENPVLDETARLSGGKWLAEMQAKEKFENVKQEGMMNRLLQGQAGKAALQDDRQAFINDQDLLKFAVNSWNDPDVKEAMSLADDDLGAAAPISSYEIVSSLKDPQLQQKLALRLRRGFEKLNARKLQQASNAAPRTVNDIKLPNPQLQKYMDVIDMYKRDLPTLERMFNTSQRVFGLPGAKDRLLAYGKGLMHSQDPEDQALVQAVQDLKSNKNIIVSAYTKANSGLAATDAEREAYNVIIASSDADPALIDHTAYQQAVATFIRYLHRAAKYSQGNISNPNAFLEPLPDPSFLPPEISQGKKAPKKSAAPAAALSPEEEAELQQYEAEFAKARPQ